MNILKKRIFTPTGIFGDKQVVGFILNIILGLTFFDFIKNDFFNKKIKILDFISYFIGEFSYYFFR